MKDKYKNNMEFFFNVLFLILLLAYDVFVIYDTYNTELDFNSLVLFLMVNGGALFILAMDNIVFELINIEKLLEVKKK